MKRVRRHSWLVTLPLVAISAAYLWLVFLPGQRSISALETELADKRAFIASGAHVADCRAQFEYKLADLQAYCKRWEPKASDSAQLAALYGEIAELLKASGVATTHFSPGPDAEARPDPQDLAQDRIRGDLRASRQRVDEARKDARAIVGGRRKPRNAG